eukprot:COSAG01_NODE_28534_length_658_cov_106.377460_1_plen_26_part_10
MWAAGSACAASAVAPLPWVYCVGAWG